VVYAWFMMLQEVACYIPSHVTRYNMWVLLQARIAVKYLIVRPTWATSAVLSSTGAFQPKPSNKGINYRSQDCHGQDC
jgi:hypothetical protein